MILVTERKLLTDMINSPEYQIFESETVLSLQYRIINPSFFNNIDLVTNQDKINCFYDYVDYYLDSLRDRINKEIEDLENYLSDNNQLDEILIDFKEVNQQ